MTTVIGLENGGWLTVLNRRPDRRCDHDVPVQIMVQAPMRSGRAFVLMLTPTEKRQLIEALRNA